MSLVHTDFVLTSEQLEKINCCIDEAARKHAEAGSEPQSSAAVKFSWTPEFGRSITVYFDGSEADWWIADI